MNLISTTDKEKLPKGYSYPIGAEIISASLKGVPQYENLTTVFAWRDQYWASQYQAKLRSQGAIEVLKVEYNSRFDRWTIRVHAVPSTHNRKVKSLLQEGILDRLKEVLLALDEHPTYFSWRANYNLAEEKIVT
jgi:hypothetical protein